MGEKDKKELELKKSLTFNKKYKGVKEKLFQSNDFFDPRDIVQVKYEMLRKVDKENCSISEASKEFGFSRPAFYEAKKKFEKEGMPGLFPIKRGRKTAYKITPEIMKYIVELRKKNFSAKKMLPLIEEKFNLTIHERSIERALNKKKPLNPRSQK